MFGMPVALTYFGAFTNVSCFRSLSTRALACDEEGEKPRAGRILLLVGISMAVVERQTLEVVVGDGRGFSRRVQ